MSVADEKSTSRISDEAFDLLGCFVAGLDDVVYQIAEHIARHRLDKMDLAEVVEISADDVASAGETVIHLLREQIAQKPNTVSPELGPILDQVEQCFANRRVRTS